MNKTMLHNFSRAGLGLAFALALAPLAAAQDQTSTTTQTSTSTTAQTSTSTSASPRTVASGQKAKIKGFIRSRDFDRNTITVRDENGVDTVVALNEQTKVRQKGGFFGGARNYA